MRCTVTIREQADRGAVTEREWNAEVGRVWDGLERAGFHFGVGVNIHTNKVEFEPAPEPPKPIRYMDRVNLLLSLGRSKADAFKFARESDLEAWNRWRLGQER